MSVRVLDGERPGYAIFVFDRPVEAASLRLAVKSLQVHPGAYVGPNGSFGRQPSYFDASRVLGDDGVAGFRVGPEIVNYFLDYDQIEVRSEDGLLCEQGLWENATPSMSPGAPPPVAAPPPPRPGPAPAAASPSPSTGAPSAPPPEPPLAASERRASGALWRYAIIGAAALIVAGVAATLPSLRCAVFHSGCPAPEDPKPQPVDSKQAPHGANQSLVDARACAAANPCVAEACYRAHLAGADAAGKTVAQAEIARATDACRPPVEPTQSVLPDGKYVARAKAGCGARAQSVDVVVKGGRISWTHRAPLADNAAPIDVPWSGSIAADGAIAAAFGNAAEYSASGRYAETEREVSMRYRGCAAPVVMTIWGQAGR
jgi:hypothetical protein